jgi:hypothetical protein
MDDKSRLQLQKMIEANNVEDHTELIRELKHSHKLIADIRTLQQLKLKCNGDITQVHAKASSECEFLYTYYTDLYNKVKNDEIDLNLLNRFLNILQQIENGELDQHEGSFVVGTILKEIYIDSALKKGEKLDKIHNEEKPTPIQPVRNITWNDYKISKL